MNAAQGFAVLVIAGVMNASFTVPMKFVRGWAWENTWLVWSIFALVMMPLLTTGTTVPHLLRLYHSAALSSVLEVTGFGLGWGIAQVLFGLAVDIIGIALTFSIVLGISAALGAVVPLLALHADRLNTPAGYTVLAGVALVLAGVIFCAIAGKMREKTSREEKASRRSPSTGLLLALLCGMGAPLINFGIAFGTPLVQVARSFGASPLRAINAVWLPLMLGGAVPNIIYCVFLLRRNGSSRRYRDGRILYWGAALVMAGFWFGSTLLYGISAAKLGPWGPILGWPLFMSLIVITASLLGVMTGEWKGSGRRPIRLQWAGVTLLSIAVFTLAASSRYF